MNNGVQFFKPYFPNDKRRKYLESADEILQSGTLMMGPWVEKFENSFGNLCGTEYAVSVNSATTALQISLQFFDVKGKEVLVPAGSFVTDISAIMFAGGNPVLVDMNPDTLSFDMQDLEAKYSKNTAGLIWVHLTGVISNEIEKIQNFALGKGIFLIEDASHAHGSTINDKTAGSLGDVGVFSFYPTKVVTTGTGGMLTTDNASLKEYAVRLRMFGKDPATGDITALGNDWFLDELRCCLGWHCLADLEDQLLRRQEIATRYTKIFQNQKNVHLLDIGSNQLPAWYHYTIFLGVEIDRVAFSNTLKENYCIGTKQIYKPTHFEPVFRHLDNGTLGKTERTLQQSLCLPMFVDLSDADVDYIGETVIRELENITDK